MSQSGLFHLPDLEQKNAAAVVDAGSTSDQAQPAKAVALLDSLIAKPAAGKESTGQPAARTSNTVLSSSGEETRCKSKYC